MKNNNCYFFGYYDNEEGGRGNKIRMAKKLLNFLKNYKNKKL